MQMRGAVREGAEVKFYEGFDGHSMPTVWHDPDGDGYTPVPVLTKLHVPPGYWDEVVRRLTTDDSDLIDRYNLALARGDSAQQTINMLNAENRALIKALEDKRDRDTNPDTKDFLDAICGDGPRAGDWADKPHRLVYDLINKVTALHADIRR